MSFYAASVPLFVPYLPFLLCLFIVYDGGADALLGENLQQQAVGNPAVQDMDAAHAAVEVQLLSLGSMPPPMKPPDISSSAWDAVILEMKPSLVS